MSKDNTTKNTIPDALTTKRREISEKMRWLMDLGALASMSNEFPIDKVTDECHKPLGYAINLLAGEIMEEFDEYAIVMRSLIGMEEIDMDTIRAEAAKDQ